MSASAASSSLLAVSGATGQLGHLVLSQLLDGGFPAARLVALVRTVSKAKELSDKGVNVREFDYSRADTLAPSLSGVSTLLLVSSSEVGKRAAQHQAVLTAAKAAGVTRVVYTSLLHADSSPLSLAGEHRETEAAVRASGLAFTILRNGWYTENYTQSIPAAIKGGAFYGSAKDGKISSAARADYAAAAVVVLKAAADLKAGAASAYDGQTIELAGDSAYTLSELAAELTTQLGAGSKVIPYTDLPAADYAKALAGFGLPAFLADAIASWDADAAKGALFDDSKQLSKLIGRPTTTLAVSVAQAVKAAQASK